MNDNAGYIRPMRNEERQAIMHLDMLCASFYNAVDALKPRLDGDKNVKRDVGMMKYICNRLVREALRGFPDDMAAVILRQSRDYCLGLEKKSVTARPEEVVMPMEDEWQFVHLVLDSRCKICLNNAAECRKCGVRKLLRKYANEPEPGDLTPCGFMGTDVCASKKINTPEKL